jgi:hypothetical protein
MPHLKFPRPLKAVIFTSCVSRQCHNLASKYGAFLLLLRGRVLLISGDVGAGSQIWADCMGAPISDKGTIF